MSEGYSEEVYKHFRSPQNVGKIKSPSAIGKVGNPQCGDIMYIYIKVNDKTKIIEDCKFQTFGCAAAIASSSVATELIKGKTIFEAFKITNEDVISELGSLPERKIHCSLLAEEGIKKAILEYCSEKNIDPLVSD